MRLFALLASFILGGSSPALLYAQATHAQPLGVPTGEAHFTIIQASDGKTVGSADYTVATALGGYQISSRGQLALQKFSYSFSNNNRLDPQLNIVHDELSGTVNGAQVSFTLTSDSTGRQFQVNIVANGKTTTNDFDRHQHSVLLPDLDAAAYVEMAHFAVEHPATTWIVIPKQNGLLVPSDYEAQPDVNAKFHGQPITLHHTSVILSAQNGISIELYYTGEGNLLEADLPEQNFYVIRDDFKLDDRPHYTPPRNAAPPPAQQPGQPPQYSVPQGGAPPQVQPQALLQAY